jgi:hypothetical protein
VAAAAPALIFGERRLSIEGTLCPALHDGVLTVLTQLREWFDNSRTIPTIEATQGFEARRQCMPGRAAQFFSGGVDAWATLRRNRLMYPADHPLSIRDCLYVFGWHPFDFEEGKLSLERFTAWERNCRRLQLVSAVAGVELHPLITNIHTVFDDRPFYGDTNSSAILFAPGHLLTPRLSHLMIASSAHLGELVPHSTHPLIDPYYSSADLQIQHDSSRPTRLEKVRLVAEWPAALRALHVCVHNRPPEDRMNCGKCPKCLRTMTELLICGRLQDAVTFPADDVDAAWIRAVHLRVDLENAYWVECLEPLAQMGRHDLIEAIKYLIADSHQRQRRKTGHGWKPKLKKLDEKLLGGWLRRQWLVHHR